MICENCEGTGIDSGLCSNCSGSGEGYHEGSRCMVCKGQGEDSGECEECKGTGETFTGCETCEFYPEGICLKNNPEVEQVENKEIDCEFYLEYENES